MFSLLSPSNLIINFEPYKKAEDALRSMKINKAT